MVHKLININHISNKLEVVRSIKQDLGIGTLSAHNLMNKIISDNQVDMLELYEWIKTTEMVDARLATNEYYWKNIFGGDLLSDIRGGKLPTSVEELKQQEEDKKILSDKIYMANKWLEGLDDKEKAHLKVLVDNYIICGGPACG